MQVKELSLILGKTLSKVTQQGNESIIFETVDGEKFKMYHEQDCCEGVEIEDIVGDLNSLVGNPLITAEERSTCTGEPEGDQLAKKYQNREYGIDSATWTFYELATIKGSVTIRWVGESNGYYSESVDLIQIA
jgi:hypothetical protein